MVTTTTTPPTITAEQVRAYNAVVDAAQTLADSLGTDPDNALDWSGEGECDGFGYALLDQITDLQNALRPFTFHDVQRVQ